MCSMMTYQMSAREQNCNFPRPPRIRRFTCRPKPCTCTTSLLLSLVLVGTFIQHNLFSFAPFFATAEQTNCTTSDNCTMAELFCIPASNETKMQFNEEYGSGSDGGACICLPLDPGSRSVACPADTMVGMSDGELGCQADDDPCSDKRPLCTSGTCSVVDATEAISADGDCTASTACGLTEIYCIPGTNETKVHFDKEYGSGSGGECICIPFVVGVNSVECPAGTFVGASDAVGGCQADDDPCSDKIALCDRGTCSVGDDPSSNVMDPGGGGESSAPSLQPSSTTNTPSLSPSMNATDPGGGGESSNSTSNSTNTTAPSNTPSLQPSSTTSIPSLSPSMSNVTDANVTDAPTSRPSLSPSESPSLLLSSSPSSMPSSLPTVSVAPTVSERPSSGPTISAQPSLSSAPSGIPSSRPSSGPSLLPSLVPSPQPSGRPSNVRDPGGGGESSAPSLQPSSTTSIPSLSPSMSNVTDVNVTDAPTSRPSLSPSESPSLLPSSSRSSMPSSLPTVSVAPTVSERPSSGPTISAQPSLSSAPSGIPSSRPSSGPSLSPSLVPSPQPSGSPSNVKDPGGGGESSAPTLQPSSTTSIPSLTPSLSPSISNVPEPTANMTNATMNNTTMKSLTPSSAPSLQPTANMTNATMPSIDEDLLLSRSFDVESMNNIKLGKKARPVTLAPEGRADGLKDQVLRLWAFPCRRTRIIDNLPGANITLRPDAKGVKVECVYGLEGRRKGALFFEAGIEFAIAGPNGTETRRVAARRKLVKRAAHISAQRYSRDVVVPGVSPDGTVVQVTKLVYTVVNKFRGRCRGRRRSRRFRQKFFLSQCQLMNSDNNSVQLHNVLQHKLREHND